VTTIDSATTTRRRSAVKIVGALSAVGAAVAVAGMGTFGNFTDSSTPMNTTIASGTVDVSANAVGVAIPASTTGFVPGDSLTRAVTLVNSGTSALGSVVLTTNVDTSSILTSDTTNGLQLAVKSCAVAWTQGGTAGAPTYTCGSGEQLLGSAPVISNLNLGSVASLNPGGTDYLAFSISLPTTADNTFQNKSAALSLTFTGTQRTGTVR
jgi:hypothetical protein